MALPKAELALLRKINYSGKPRPCKLDVVPEIFLKIILPIISPFLIIFFYIYLMLLTLDTTAFKPISMIDLHHIKRTYLKQYNSYLLGVGKFIKARFKETAFYHFFLIATADAK